MSAGFARELLKIVIAQICQTMDCDGMEQSACETMVDILQHYIEEVGYLSHCYSEHSGRVECNFNDVELALKDMGVKMKELMLYNSKFEEMPFARAIPRFPMGPSQKRRKVLTSPEALPSHIPVYLPPFPDKHAFVETPLFLEREKERTKIRSIKNREKEQLEENLTKLHSKIAKSNITNYDQPVVANNFSDDFSKLREIKPTNSPIVSPTPVDHESPFLAQLYHVVIPSVNEDEKKDTDGNNPTVKGPEEDQTEKERREKKIDEILNLQHENNQIDQLHLDLPQELNINGQNGNKLTTTTTTTTPDSILVKQEKTL